MGQEFFKWLENLSENDVKKFNDHILNCPDSKRKFAYPKVTIKGIPSVLPNCYTAKEWIERRKLKLLVKMEIHLLKPNVTA